MIEQQIARLSRGVADFESAILALGQAAFLEKMIGRWTPRDIVAHLIGWNAYVIDGSRQLQRGELPFYDVDPGENYEKVNAILVRQNASRDRSELLEALHTSARDLAQFLRSLDTDTWGRDFGVRHGEEVVTIRGTVDELIADYDHHREQLETSGI